ncbi:hypothetical protein SANTM175S_03847 [Streptomyces antimycoticus]
MCSAPSSGPSDLLTDDAQVSGRFPTRLTRLISTPHSAAPAKATQVTRRASAAYPHGFCTVRRAQEHGPEDRDAGEQAELSRCHQNPAGVRRVLLRLTVANVRASRGL